MASEHPSVHYRSPDPTQNLRIKVTLTRVSGPRTHRVTDGGTEQQAALPAPGDDQRPLDAVATQPSSAPPTALAHAQSAKGVSHSRVIGWQERVFGRHEVAEYQNRKAGIHPTQPQQQGGLFGSGFFGWFSAGKGGDQGRPAQEGSLATAEESHIYDGADALRKKYDNELEKLVASGGTGEVIYTHTSADAYNEVDLGARDVTTSPTEHLTHLNQKTDNAMKRNEVVRYQTMYIMAECGNDFGEGGPVESVPLVSFKAYPNGSFDMRPGFCRPGAKYTFEKSDGSLYEYTVENSSDREPTALERRQTNLQKDAFERAARMRRHAGSNDFTPLPGPSPDALRLVLFAEISAARRFPRDNIMVEYFVKFDPQVWRPAEGAPLARLRGVTQISRARTEGVDEATGAAAHHVAHFSLPLELELVAQDTPPSQEWPVLFFKVASYDTWDRYTVDGYGYLSLHGHCPGVKTHYVDTWAPFGTVQDRLHAHFVGGMPEVEDISYVAIPEDFKGAALSRFGFSTVASGQLKVKTHALVQQRAPLELSGPRSTPSAKRPVKRSLYAVVERARARLREARGGEIGVKREAVQPSVLRAAEPYTVKDRSIQERPVIVHGPESVTVDKGAKATFTVKATGPGRLRYQWYKDHGKLKGETSEVLVVMDCREEDEGLYMVEVKTDQGMSRASNDARLAVRSARTVSRRAVARPRFVDGPRDARVDEGDDATFEVEVEGEKPIAYQWYRNGKRLSGETGARLRVKDCRQADVGGYSCEAENAGGKDESREAKLEVVVPRAKELRSPPKEVAKKESPPKRVARKPEIIRHPADLEVAEGSPAVFQVQAEGDKPLQYQWRRDGKPLTGERDATLKVSPVDKGHVGRYTCVVSNEAGEEESHGARLDLVKAKEEPPYIIVQLTPLELVADEGSKATFHVEVGGTKPVKFRWLHDGEHVKGEDGNDLAVRVGYDTMGRYQVEATNEFGKVLSSEAQLHVASPDIFTLMELHMEKHQTRLKEMFMQVDVDKNNKLSTKELHKLVAKVHPQVTKKQLKHFKVMVDADGDGFVTFKELQIAIKESKKTGNFLRDPNLDREGTVSMADVMQRLSEHVEDKGNNAKKVFEEFDTDKSGYLEREEIMKLFRKVLPSIKTEDLRLVMQHLYELDENGDDKLTYDELLKALKDKPARVRRADLGRHGGLSKTPRELEMEKHRISRRKQKEGSDDD